MGQILNKVSTMMKQACLWDPYLDPRVPVRFLQFRELKHMEEDTENKHVEQKKATEDKHEVRKATLKQTVSRMFAIKQCINQMSAMMNQNHLWELLNNVPARFLNTNIGEAENNQLNTVVDDSRIPHRFVPRPKRLYDPSKDPRVPVRFIEPTEKKHSLENKPLEKGIEDKQNEFKTIEDKPSRQKPSQPLRRTNPRTINKNIKQLMTELVDKVDDENKENEGKNSALISIFDTLYK